MKRSSAGLPATSLAACCACLALASTRAHATTIAIDVGHSLAKPGAESARGVPEFTFNKALAQTVGDALRQAGFAVQMNGERGDADDLKKRGAAAKGADLLLSIHHDSVQPQYLQPWSFEGKRHRATDRFAGFSLFVSRANGLLETSSRCASAIGEELRKAGFKPSLHHAEKIPGENRPLADEQNGVYYYDGLVVLKTAPTPAVLLEAGIIVNPAEEAELQQQPVRDKIAAAIVAAMPCLQGEKSATPQAAGGPKASKEGE